MTESAKEEMNQKVNTKMSDSPTSLLKNVTIKTIITMGKNVCIHSLNNLKVFAIIKRYHATSRELS